MVLKFVNSSFYCNVYNRQMVLQQGLNCEKSAEFILFAKINIDNCNCLVRILVKSA